MKVPCRRCRERSLQKLNRCTFQDDTGESSRSPCAGVDVNSIGSHVWMCNRRMSVNDVFAVLQRRIEELFTDPEQIFHCLLVEWNLRTNAGMHEEIISATNPRLQALQEQLMSPRKGAKKSLTQIF